jgi:hypothetical protein
MATTPRRYAGIQRSRLLPLSRTVAASTTTQAALKPWMTDLAPDVTDVEVRHEIANVIRPVPDIADRQTTSHVLH